MPRARRARIDCGGHYKPRREPRKTLLFHMAWIRTGTKRFLEYAKSRDHTKPRTLNGSIACEETAHGAEETRGVEVAQSVEGEA